MRRLDKERLIALSVQLGKPRAEAEKTKRWTLVQFIARYADSELADYQRDHKDNQQEKNLKFMEQVNYLFNEQSQKLQQTEVQQSDTANGFAVTSQLLNLGTLPQLNHPDDTGYDFFNGDYFQNSGDFGFGNSSHMTIPKPFGAQGNYRRIAAGYESGNGM